MKIVFATYNKGKEKEIRRILSDLKNIELSFLSEYEKIEPPVECGLTFEENAIIKCLYYKNFFNNEGVASEDSGLCIDFLEGSPGVISARFKNLRNDEEKVEEILNLMEGVPEEKRGAKFVSTIAFFDREKTTLFRGEVFGKISLSKKGSNGFGYDPIFIPNGETKTFAEMADLEKDKFSHRRISLLKLKEYLLWKI